MAPHRSFWLNEALAAEGVAAPPDPTPLPPGYRTDVCIVGGGFTGLWTAIHVKALQPDASVTLVEKDLCGSGASGRNAGFCMSWMSKARTMIPFAGAQEGVRLLRASDEAIRRIGAFAAENGIDCDFRNLGWIWTASNRAQMGAWQKTVDILGKHGLETLLPVDDGDIAGRTGSRAFQGAVEEPAVSTLQPAKLARGLRRVALARGVAIRERTRMLEVSRGPTPVVATDRGTITAGAVVLALDAWAHEMPEFRRHLLPVAYDFVVTERAGEILDRIGLARGAAVSDSSGKVASYRTTLDGRVVLGAIGDDFARFGVVGERFDRPSPVAADIAALLHRWLPELKATPIAETWRGPTTRSGNGLPHFGRLPGAERIFFGHGYTGNGVGPSYVGGQILAALALGRRDEWSECALVRPLGRPWLPREPLRSIGGAFVRRAVMRVDDAADADRPPRPLDKWLAGFAPKSLVPKKS